MFLHAINSAVISISIMFNYQNAASDISQDGNFQMPVISVIFEDIRGEVTLLH
jgi:hypothetical protein